MLPVAILAGGLATRLHPRTHQFPKAMVEINGEPFVAHQLRLLRDRGIERVVLCLGYMGGMVQEFVGDGAQFGLQVACSYDGPVLLGTAGAVRNALPLLPESFFVLYGDSYLPCDYAAIERAFQQNSKPALMTVFPNRDQWDRSNVEFANGKILAYDKKFRTARMQHIDYGLGVFHSSAFCSSAADLAGLYQELLARGQLTGVEVAERFYEIGSFEGIRELSEFLKS